MQQASIQCKKTTDTNKKETSMQKQKNKRKRRIEKWIEKVIVFFGLISIIIIALIFIFLFKSGSGIFKDVSLKEFFLGAKWYPNSVNPQFGILPLVAGSLLITFLSVLLAVPIGVGCAIFISEIAPPKVQFFCKVVIEFLSAIPSVVLGFLGIVILSSWIRTIFHLSSGFTALTGAILVALMALPTIISITDDALRAVPDHYREASLALGATPWETIRYVIIPAASSGMIAAIMLGIGRAIGETMTVMMVTGNAAKIPTSPLQSARTITATIAAEMGDTVRNSPHYHALFAMGIVLLLFTTLINWIADHVLQKNQKEGKA